MSFPAPTAQRPVRRRLARTGCLPSPRPSKPVPGAGRRTVACSSRAAAVSGRSWAARATPTATTSRRRARLRRIRWPSKWPAPHATRVSSRPGGRAARARSSGVARGIRSATTRPRTSRSAPCTTRTAGRSAGRPATRLCASSAAQLWSCLPARIPSASACWAASRIPRPWPGPAPAARRDEPGPGPRGVAGRRVPLPRAGPRGNAPRAPATTDDLGRGSGR